MPIEQTEKTARELLTRLAHARQAIRNAQSKPAYLVAVSEEWDVLREIDGYGFVDTVTKEV
jgi:hypothetical protein